MNPCHFPENDVVLIWEAIAVYMVPIVGQLIQSVEHFPQILLIDHGCMRGECYRKSNGPQDRASELIEIDRPNVSAHAASHHGRYLFPDFI